MPHDLSVAVAALKHEIRPLRGLDFSVGAVLADQEVRGAVDVEVGYGSRHRG
jgi:hypothetical protein